MDVGDGEIDLDVFAQRAEHGFPAAVREAGGELVHAVKQLVPVIVPQAAEALLETGHDLRGIDLEFAEEIGIEGGDGVVVLFDVRQLRVVALDEGFDVALGGDEGKAIGRRCGLLPGFRFFFLPLEAADEICKLLLEEALEGIVVFTAFAGGLERDVEEVDFGAGLAVLGIFEIELADDGDAGWSLIVA